jgi:AcrR family transcriptional regulator
MRRVTATEPCISRRAAPMAPEDRRAAILAAAVPLLRERGTHLSTRELAEAAGVAEGTLFRVFPDKRSLLRAALEEAMDPEPLLGELCGIDRSLPFEPRVARVIEVIAAHMDGIMQLVTALHELARAEPGGEHQPHGAPDPKARDARVLSAVADVLAPESHALRVTPLQAAGLLRGVILGERMPGMPDGARLAPTAVARCLAHGLVRTPDDVGPGPVLDPRHELVREA